MSEAPLQEGQEMRCSFVVVQDDGTAIRARCMKKVAEGLLTACDVVRPDYHPDDSHVDRMKKMMRWVVRQIEIKDLGLIEKADSPDLLPKDPTPGMKPVGFFSTSESPGSADTQKVYNLLPRRETDSR